MAEVKQFQLDMSAPGRGVHIRVSDPDRERVVPHADKARWETKGYEPTEMVIVRMEKYTEHYYVMRRMNEFG